MACLKENLTVSISRKALCLGLGVVLSFGAISAVSPQSMAQETTAAEREAKIRELEARVKAAEQEAYIRELEAREQAAMGNATSNTNRRRAVPEPEQPTNTAVSKTQTKVQTKVEQKSNQAANRAESKLDRKIDTTIDSVTDKIFSGW